MHRTFLLHETKKTILPAETGLYWQNEQGETVRSLNMPGYIGDSIQAVGTKIINGNTANLKHGYPRASGITCLFDPLTGRPLCIMEGAYLSSLRTASVSLLATEMLSGPPIRCVGFIGAGVQAQAHIKLLLKRQPSCYPDLHQIMLFDSDPARMVECLSNLKRPAGVVPEIRFASSPEHVVRQAQVVIPTTTTTEGYIPFEWLQKGSILIHVSLDDVLPEVVFKADWVIVDDWELIRNDTRRLFGRLYRSGKLLGPDEAIPTDEEHGRRIDAQLGEICAGTKVGRQNLDDILLVNPFGLAIEDIALASEVYRQACASKMGVFLER
jgi:ornithine cyclodeaminase